MKHDLAVRYYFSDGLLDRVGFSGIGFPKENAKGLARSLLAIDEVLGAVEGYQQLNPCNISVRGPSGRFVKWKK